MWLLKPQSLVLKSNSLSNTFRSLIEYHHNDCLFHAILIAHLFISVRTPHGVWKSLLDESENKAKQRLAISEELQGQMAESMKTLKSNKAQVFKKVCVTQYMQEKQCY